MLLNKNKEQLRKNKKRMKKLYVIRNPQKLVAKQHFKKKEIYSKKSKDLRKK
jgi:hypothetical protein